VCVCVCVCVCVYFTHRHLNEQYITGEHARHIKGNAYPIHAMKAYRGSICICIGIGIGITHVLGTRRR